MSTGSVGQVAEVDQAKAHRDVGDAEARGQRDRVGAVAVGVLAHERLGHQQLGGEAVGLALARALVARVGRLDVGRPAQHRRAVGVQQMVADLVGDREAAPRRAARRGAPRSPTAAGSSTPESGVSDGSARDRAQVVGVAHAQPAQARRRAPRRRAAAAARHRSR